MLNFSTDPQVAEKQMRAIIFYLTTFGHIDGEFDAIERTFVRSYIEKLVGHRVATGAGDLTESIQLTLKEKYTAHFHDLFEKMDLQVKELLTEAVDHDENQDSFVYATLQLRCFETFQGFDHESQAQLMAAIDHLIMADGEAHPAEVKFRAELARLLDADLRLDFCATSSLPRPTLHPALALDSGNRTHPFFDQFEFHYSSEPDRIQRQLSADLEAVHRAAALLEERSKGHGRLAGKTSMDELHGEGELHEGRLQICPAQAGKRYELTVLGDLHGCYSCLKAAVIQSRFFERVAAFRASPDQHPEPKLVLLGDYIDRGIFGLNGVLRAVLHIYLRAPEHVVFLRGNHEYFIEHKGEYYGGVKPSEAIDTLKPHVPAETFRDYIRLFDAMTTVFIFDRIFFVHAGIPRDRALKERFKDLTCLDDPELRFQMIWSDPSSADVVPVALQEQSTRFAFGKLQAQHFLQKIGCTTLIRGHEKVDEGLERVFETPHFLFLTLFSAGGADNDDLPADSSYRRVTPMALTIRHEDGKSEITPWPIDYKAYNDPERNAFFRRPPELRFGG